MFSLQASLSKNAAATRMPSLVSTRTKKVEWSDDRTGLNERNVNGSALERRDNHILVGQSGGRLLPESRSYGGGEKGF